MMDRAEWLCKQARRLLLLCVLLGLAALQGCRTHDDAVAAAEQMAETATTLRQYYATLDGLVVKTVEVRRAQRYLLQGPPDPGSEERLELRRAELRKRVVLAGDVAKLAALFGEITSSDAATDAAKTAEDLRLQVVGLKLLSDDATVKSGLEVAVTSLVNLIRAHDEVKAAKVLNPVLVALCHFYDAEKPVYVAVADDYDTGAAANAAVLIDKGQVAVQQQYRSSLEPFHLDAELNLPELKAAARDDMKADVESRRDALNQGNADAANALGDALGRMQARVETVAKGGALRIRKVPLSLDAVKAWIAELHTLTGVSL